MFSPLPVRLHARTRTVSDLDAAVLQLAHTVGGGNARVGFAERLARDGTVGNPMAGEVATARVVAARGPAHVVLRRTRTAGVASDNDRPVSEVALDAACAVQK